MKKIWFIFLLFIGISFVKADNPYLNNLGIREAIEPFIFESDQFVYDTKVPSDIESITVDYDAPENYEVEIIGDRDLGKAENLVIVKVMNEEGNSVNYEINVRKDIVKEEEKQKKSSVSKYIPIIIIGLIIAAVVVFLIIKKDVK